MGLRTGAVPRPVKAEKPEGHRCRILTVLTITANQLLHTTISRTAEQQRSQPTFGDCNRPPEAHQHFAHGRESVGLLCDLWGRPLLECWQQHNHYQTIQVGMWACGHVSMQVGLSRGQLPATL